MNKQKTYIFFDYYLEDYFRVTYLHDSYLFVRNEFTNEDAFMPIDEEMQKEILRTQRHAVIDEDEDVIVTMNQEIAKVRGIVQ